MNSEEKLFFKGIYGDDSINMVRETIHIASLGSSTERKKSYIKLHSHNDLFQIFVIESGKMDLLLNDQEIPIESVSFFSIPINTAHGFRKNNDLSGWVISLLDKNIENMLRLDTDIIVSIDEVHVYKLDRKNKLISDAYNTIQKCIYEYNSSLPARQYALQYLVGMLLLRLFRIPSEAKKSYQVIDNKKVIIYRRFLQLIKERNQFKYTVEEFASDLDISAGYLNKICHEVSGIPPKDIIVDHFISEIKLLLSDFNLSIADVAYKIGLNDPGYLTRLFKKKTSLTPKEYRHSIGL
jgi:AraC-like DNA-binding protein